MCNKSEAMIILKEVFERSRAIFGRSLVNGYLYGSYARGDYDEESDVDILLTVDQSDDDIRAQNKSLVKIDSDLSLDYNVTVSVTVKPLEQFNGSAKKSL
jgi:predicted nucleotidyltransferase